MTAKELIKKMILSKNRSEFDSYRPEFEKLSEHDQYLVSTGYTLVKRYELQYGVIPYVKLDETIDIAIERVEELIIEAGV